MAASAHPVFDGDCRKVSIDAAVASGGTTSAAVDISNFNQGIFFLPAEFNGDTITIQVSNSTNGTFTALYLDGALTAYQFTAVGDTWNELPAGVFGAGAVRILTGSATSAAATITFCLKT